MIYDAIPRAAILDSSSVRRLADWIAQQDDENTDYQTLAVCMQALAVWEPEWDDDEE